MAQLAVAGAGAIIGGVIGGPMGAQIGWALGGVAGALLFPPEGPTTEGPRLSDLAIQTSGYGVPIPAVAGIAKIAGNVIWSTVVEERKTTRRQGKGGGGAKTVTYTYYQSFAVGLCEWMLPPAQPEVLRIWLDTILVYDTTAGSEVTQVPGLAWRFHDGNDAQLPDALIESHEGEDAPAHRGLAYVVFEDLPLDRFGNRMPNVTVELVAQAARSFTQVATVPPASPLYPSNPSQRTFHAIYAMNVAVDNARGRIYEARSRSSGATGAANDELIRVYDLSTMETISEYPMGDIVEPMRGLFGAPLTTESVGGGLIHLAADGYLYCTGGSGPQVPLWKISPDTWRAVDVFGNPYGNGITFVDDATCLFFPRQITSVQVPRLGSTPRTFIIVQGSYSAMMTIDADRMEYVWGYSGAIEPAPPAWTFGLAQTSFPILFVRGRVRDDGGAEMWCLRGWDSPGRIEVIRYRFYSGAAPMGISVAMGIFRDDYDAIDIVGLVDSGATAPTLQAAWYDYADDTLVITISGQGTGFGVFSRFSTFKWAPGVDDGVVVWKQVDHALQDRHDGRGDMGRVFGAAWGLGGNVYMQMATGDALVNQSGEPFNNLFWLDERQAAIGFVEDGTHTFEIAKRYLNRLAAVDLSVADVIEAIAVRSGMDAADLDVGAIDIPLRGYVLARPMSARDAIAPLATYAQADAVELDDVLTFVPRGGAVAATIAYAAMVRESPDASVLEEQRAQDAELPREVTVRYLDIERGWEMGAQSWRRPVSPTPTVSSSAVAAIDLPIPLVADEAKTVAKRLCVATWRERTRLSLSVGPAHARLVPTDVVQIGTRDGATIRARVLNAQLGANWVTRLECVTEDAAAYSLTATGDNGSGWVEPTMPMPYYTRLIVPDLALVEDGDDLAQAGLREYAFACAYAGGRWRGVTLFRSADYASWSEIGSIFDPVSWGTVATPAAVPATPWTWDEVGSLVITMADGEPDSATALEVLNGANMAALIALDGTAEVIQWRDAAADGGGRYTLTGLLRGRRGTEDLIASRSAGDAFVVLDGTRFQFTAGPTEAFAARYLRPVGIYDTVETAPSTVAKTARGRAERPYAPVHIAGSRDGSNNLTLTWVRRTRVGGEWLDGTGTVPVSEASEVYEVDIVNGPPAVPRAYSASAVFADGYEAAQAFNGGTGGFPWGAPTNTGWIRVDFATAQTVFRYALQCPDSGALTSMARDWTFEGWTGSAWVALDTRSGQTGWASGETRSYAIASPGSYLAYRVNVSANNGSTFLGIEEVSLFPSLGAAANIAASTYVAPAVVRTITGLGSPTAPYSAADQTTDFGAAQAAVFVAVYQISNIVGRGIAGEAVV